MGTDGTVPPTGSVYVALVPPPDLAAALAVPRGVRPDRLHVTVVYVGRTRDLDPGVPARVVQAVAGVARRHPPLEVRTGGLGRFGDGGRRSPSVAWVGVSAPGLDALRGDLVDELERRGVTVDGRPFRPHLTLRYDRPGMAALAPPPELRFTARELWAVAGSDRWSRRLRGMEGRPPPRPPRR